MSGPDWVCKAVLVQGRVQGVGFRAWVARRALELEVSGWVRNRADGRVEVYACAPPEVLSRFLELVRQGPPLARVAGLEPLDAGSAAAPAGDFEIR